MEQITAMPAFNVIFPDGWEDQTIYTFKGPDDSGVQHLVTLTIDPTPSSADVADFARERIDMVMETLQGAMILKDEEKQLANGSTAYECVYKWIPVDGMVRFVKMLFLLIDGRGYTFSGTFSKKTIRTIALEMDQIVNSFTPTRSK